MPVVGYESFPNDAHNARVITLAEHEQIVAPLGLSGLLTYTSTAPVFADSSGMQVKLRAGVAASLRGTRFNNLTETLISITSNASGNPRIDLVVLRLRRTESSLGAGDQYTVAPFVIEGTPAATPVAPSPVRDDTPGAGFWDIPLAEVTVPSGDVSIDAAQVATRAYFISGSGYAGRDDWGKPPVEPGVFFRANDTGITYVGTAAGAWQSLYYDTGWVDITTGKDKAGWDFRDFAVARSGNIVTMSMYLVRDGGGIGASTSQYFGPVPSQFKPSRNVYGVAYIQSPDHATHAAVTADGQILLAANGSQGINTNAQVLCNMAWRAG